MRTSLLIDWLAHSLTLQVLILSLPLLHPPGYVHLAYFPKWPHSVSVVACQSIPFAQLLILFLVRPEIILGH